MLPLCFTFVLLLVSRCEAKDFFRAAVFEYRPEFETVLDVAPRDVISTSLNKFKKAVELASSDGADIIVFNEYGVSVNPQTRRNYLNFAENVPDPDRRPLNPCMEDLGTILKTLSCLAKDNSIYLVANMVDAKPCEGTCDANNIVECRTCPEDGYHIYNTNVVFDRDGNLVSRYHKVHPYFEVVDVPDEPEFRTFDTDFGKFGSIVCFDSVFEEAMVLARDHGIDTLLFLTFWFDDIVPLNSVEWQQAWALANGVNFLAANAQKAQNATLGSGIYSKNGGALVYSFEPDDESKLLIANLPVKADTVVPSDASVTIVRNNGNFPKQETGELFPDVCYVGVKGPPKHFADYRCYKVQTENYTLVKLETPSGKIESCNNGFCCELTYSADDMEESYYLASKKGLNNVRGFFQWSEESCMLLRCDPFGDSPCARQPPRSSRVFRHAKLKAQFESEIVYPAVSQTNFRLAPKSEWSVDRKGSELTLFYVNENEQPLLKVALFGRNYKRDPDFVPFFKSGVKTTTSNGVLF